MTSPVPIIGRTLSHYRIVAQPGAGGIGVLYLAEDQVLGRKAAIKLLQPDLLHNELAKARFLREARAGAALNHPNIAVLYEVGESEGQVFLAMHAGI